MKIKFKKVTAFLSSVALALTMFLNFPNGMFDNMHVSAADEQTTSVQTAYSVDNEFTPLMTIQNHSITVINNHDGTLTVTMPTLKSNSGLHSKDSSATLSYLIDATDDNYDSYFLNNKIGDAGNGWETECTDYINTTKETVNVNISSYLDQSKTWLATIITSGFANVYAAPAAWSIYGIKSYKFPTKVTFDADGGSNAPDVDWVENGDALSTTIPTKDGYFFDGWYTQKNGGGVKITNGAECVANETSGSITLYAKWTVHNYKDGVCTKCGEYTAAVYNENEDVYEISDAYQLVWFADKVNNETAKYMGANAKLMNDIDMSDVCSAEKGNWTPIRMNQGHFNGNNKAIKNLYFNDAEADYVGLFGQLNGALQVENLSIVDCNLTGKEYVGGISGYANNVTFNNCSVVGGSINAASENSYESEYSYTNVGAFCGVSAYVAINNSYSTANITTDGKVIYSLTGGNANIQIDNSYLLAQKGVEGNKNEALKTAEQFENGEVANLLQTQNTPWGQEIGKDKTPVFKDAKVYKGYKDCGVSFSNNESDLSNSPAAEHQYKDGVCSVCGELEALTVNADGFYEIYNAANLYWYAEAVNKGNVSSISKAKLMNDIDLSTVCGKDIGVWPIIGLDNEYNLYSGTFDGQGYSIKNLYYNVPCDAYMPGLFGYTGSAIIQNVKLVDCDITGNNNVGGIVGRNDWGEVKYCAGP